MTLTAATDEFESRLRAMIPPGAFPQETDSYLAEPRGRWAGQGLVVAPGTTQQVADVAAACFEARVPIVPYSGGTGLVGGQIAEDGPRPVVLSLARMSSVRAIYPNENVIEVDAGIILADVQKEAAEVDRLFPLSLASEGSR